MYLPSEIGISIFCFAIIDYSVFFFLQTLNPSQLLFSQIQ